MKQFLFEGHNVGLRSASIPVREMRGCEIGRVLDNLADACEQGINCRAFASDLRDMARRLSECYADEESGEWEDFKDQIESAEDAARSAVSHAEDSLASVRSIQQALNRRSA